MLRLFEVNEQKPCDATYKASSAMMTGSLVVEKIFSIPGVGSLLVTAIQSNDYNVVIALSFIYSAMYIGIMLVVDILYGIIDPRIRVAKDGGKKK